MKALLDTSAWIGYFEGDRIGEKVSDLLKNKENEFFTLSLIIAEVISKIKRKKGNTETALRVINLSSNLIDFDMITAKEAGLLHAEEKEKNDSFGLIDAIIIKTAQKNNLKIITSDNHFKSFKEALIL